MKKIALLMALIMMAGTLAACGDDASDESTAAPTGGASVSTTGAQGSQSTPAATDGTTPDTTTAADTNADPDTTPEVTTTAEETEPDTPDPTDPDGEYDYPAEDVFTLPNGTVGDTALEGYDVWGAWSTDDGKLVSDAEHSMFVVTNDRMSAGKLSATFTSNGDSAENDNGIVFGMEDNYSLDDCWFWEDPINYPRAPRYYFLFISDRGTLYLAKVACNGQAWTELAQSQIVIGYAHGGEVSVSVEFDGQGNIKCYANDELLIEYQDTNGPTGDRYGVRCEVPDVIYHSVVAEHAE